MKDLSGEKKRAATVVAIIVTVIVLWFRLRFFIANAFADLSFSSLPYDDDFNHYYCSARLVIRGLPGYCSDFSLLGDEVSLFRWHPQTRIATNPPLLVLMFVPYALLSPAWAWLAWECTLIGAICGALYLIVSELHPRLLHLPALGFVALATFLSSPVLSALRYSQVQPIAVLLCLAGWRSLRRDRTRSAAVFWTAAVSIKIFPWPLLVYLVARKGREGLRSVMGAAALLLLLPVLVERDVYSGFIRCALPALNWWTEHSSLNVGFGGLVNRTLSWWISAPFEFTGREGLFTFFALPALFAAVAAVMLGTRVSSMQQHDLVCAILLVLSAFCSPLSWPHYQLCYLLFFFIVLGARSSFGAKAGLFLLWLSLPLYPSLFIPRTERFLSLLNALAPFLPMLIFAFMVREPLRSMRHRVDSSSAGADGRSS